MTAVPPSPAPTGAPSPVTSGFASSPAVWVFGILNVAGYLWLESHGGALSGQAMLANGALRVPMIAGEPWRLLTNTFLHWGAFHLVSNMIGLGLFGPAFERLVGTTRFVALWLAAGLAGSAATVLTASGNGLTIAAGASGSVFGLLGAYLFIGWRTRHTPAGAARLRQASTLLLINFVYGVVTPNIGMAAHLGGTVAGVVILSAYAAPKPAAGAPPATPNPHRGLGVAVGLGIASVAAALAFGRTF